MVASAALGAAAVQTLHAQTKPPAYNIAEITIKDQDGYNKEYLPLITECWFEGRPILRDEYLIVDHGHLAGAGAHSYSVGTTA
jgi:hypothetical protein